MATCKNCLYCDICNKTETDITKGNKENAVDLYCESFKNKADFVEVVRCKDCKYCEDRAMSGLWCTHPDNRNPLGCRKEDYCSDGAGRLIERRIAQKMKKICAMVVKLDGSYIYTNIEASDEKLKVLKKRYCHFFVHNGCFAYKTYRSFMRSLRLWEQAKKDAEREAWRQRYEGIC